MTSLSHEERTAHEPRRSNLHSVKLANVETVNDNVRVFRLDIIDRPEGIEFLAGQWVDLHVPGIEKAGGFSITSTPKAAVEVKAPNDGGIRKPYIELAVQRSPDNPPAAWLWRPEVQILGRELKLRVGGSFIFPPLHVDLTTITGFIFIAGGMGINPLVSIISSIVDLGLHQKVRLKYAMKYQGAELEKYLFALRLKTIQDSSTDAVDVELFLTGATESDIQQHSHQLRSIFPNISFVRPTFADVNQPGMTEASWEKRVVYICGPPAMTDDFYNYIRELRGMSPQRVLCEKWW